MSVIEGVYARGTTFLRDVFSYAVPGLVFSGLVLGALVWSGHLDVQLPDEIATSTGIVLILALCLVAYVVGQMLFSLSYLQFAVFEFVGRRVARNAFRRLDNRLQQLRTCLESLQDEEEGKRVLSDLPAHLYCELKVFTEMPALHNKFVERYNTLRYVKRTLSACFFFVAIAYCIMLPQTLHAVIVEIGFVLLSLLFFRQYVLARIGFLDRCYVGYIVASETAKKD